MTKTDITPTPEDAKTRKPLYKRWWVYAIGAVVVIGIANSGSDSPEVVESDTPSATTVAVAPEAEAPATTVAPEAEAPATTVAPASETGTQENPAAVGDTVAFDEWEVTFNGATVATDAVLAENMLNEKPEAGYEYVLLNISATYTGTESSTFWTQFQAFILGSEGNSFGTDLETICVAPESMTDAGEVFAGGKIQGNICVPMEMAQIGGAMAVVDYLWSLDEERVFFELGL